MTSPPTPGLYADKLTVVTAQEPHLVLWSTHWFNAGWRDGEEPDGSFKIAI